MADYKGVMVFAEVLNGKLAPIATEGLGCGRKLAGGLGQELCAVVLGSGLGEVAKEAIAFGADKVYTVDDPLLKDYQSDAYLTVMEKVAKQVTPQIIIFGQTAIGRDLAPRLASRLNSSATMDCVDLSIDPFRLRRGRHRI